MRHFRDLAPPLLPLLFVATALAQEDPAPEPDQPLVPAPVVRTHRALIGGVSIDYETRAGLLSLKADGGEARAEVFHVAYLRLGQEDPARRPLTFVFNGGPGSSSVWLHLGAFGPQRVAMDPEGFPLAPPGRLVPNEHSLLDLTDLVFIDPVTTGYSRPAEDVERGEFHGVSEDVRSVAEFIRAWTTENERWASPKFLAGESYGTTRAAGLAGHLQQRHGMYLSGLVLVSSILEFQTARFDPGNDLPYVLFLPTYAAIARYHGALQGELATRPLGDFLDEVEDFALGDYASGLLLGNRIDLAAKRRLAQRVADYIGLDVDYVLGANLRVRIQRFTKQLLRDQRLTVGRLDGRFRSKDRDAVGERYEYDPSMAAIQGPYTEALNDYVRRSLGYRSERVYEILTGGVHPWNWDSENAYVNVAETLRGAMTRNPRLRVYVASGIYDLATPYFATQHTFEHLDFEGELAQRVHMGSYPAGHMMYIQHASLAQLRDELVPFYAECLSAEGR